MDIGILKTTGNDQYEINSIMNCSNPLFSIAPLFPKTPILLMTAWLAQGGVAVGGIYSKANDDATNPYDAPIPGWVGPAGEGASPYDDWSEFQDNGNFINPLFFDWANEAVDYSPAPGVSSTWTSYIDRFDENVIGPVSGDVFSVLPLGDLDDPSDFQYAAPGTDPNDLGDIDGFIGYDDPGEITLYFAEPIRNLRGADFVIYENGNGLGTGINAELAFVEVSSDGVNFIRFPSISETPAPISTYGSLDPTNVHNLAGKHTNAYGRSWGTPFNLNDLILEPAVLNETVDLDNIHYIRVVDIPGNGSFTDGQGNPIYDPWHTNGSGGFDLEAVGAISRYMDFENWPPLQNLDPADQELGDDPDEDGLPNLLEYAFARLPNISESPSELTPISLVSDEGNEYLTISFVRDERLTDLTYEVQYSTDLSTGSWTTIATAASGGETTPTLPYSPVIEEESASTIASIGVLRKVTVRDIAPLEPSKPRFLRIKVSPLP